MAITREEKNRFSMMIIELARKLGCDHMDAITTYCDQSNLEIEVAATMVNDTLKDLIQSEAAELRYLPKTSKLPL
jgi:hypothetical protein